MKPAAEITVIETPTGKTIAVSGDYGSKPSFESKPEFGPVDPEGYAQWQKDREEINGPKRPIDVNC